MTAILRKLVTGEIKALGEGKISAILSTETKDRDGDIIRVEGWDLKYFNAHPVLVDGHKYDSQSQIGEWEDLKVVGKRLQGIASYYIDEGNAAADWAYVVAEKGRAAYSVGFIPDMSKAVRLDDDDGWWPTYEFNGQELLECSHVVVPSNPQAVQRSVWAKAMARGAPGLESNVLYGPDGEGSATGANGLDQLESPTLDLAAAVEMVTLTKELVDGMDSRMDALKGQIDDLHEADLEYVIERLKTDFPHLFATPHEALDLQGVVRQWSKS